MSASDRLTIRTWQQRGNTQAAHLCSAMDLEAKANGPPENAKRAPAKSALRNLRLIAGYSLFSLLQAPFGFMFWSIEQRRSRLEDEIERRQT